MLTIMFLNQHISMTTTTIVIIIGSICIIFCVLLLLLYYIFYPAIVAARAPKLAQTIQVEIVWNDHTNTNTHIDSNSNNNNNNSSKHNDINSKTPSTTTTTGTNSCIHDTKPILSIIVPAYLEEERLPTMLQEAYEYIISSSSSSSSNSENISSSNNTTTGTNSGYRYCQSIYNLQQCTKSNSITIEWIIIDDGSNDNTSNVYRSYVQNTMKHRNNTTTETTTTISLSSLNYNNRIQHIWKLIEFPNNQGKGAAVQAGMLNSTGYYSLMVDADGATEFNTGLEQLTNTLVSLVYTEKSLPSTNTTTVSNDNSTESNCNSINDIVLFGSRDTLRKKEIELMGRSYVRDIISYIFHLCVLVFVDSTCTIQDTQCGFKLFSSSACYKIFTIIHLRRWAFDIELIYIARYLQITIIEVQLVKWIEIVGSKLNTSSINLALVSISMLRDMICVRLCYTFGLWKIVLVTTTNGSSSSGNNTTIHQSIPKATTTTTTLTRIMDNNNKKVL